MPTPRTEQVLLSSLLSLCVECRMSIHHCVASFLTKPHMAVVASSSFRCAGTSLAEEESCVTVTHLDSTAIATQLPHATNTVDSHKPLDAAHPVSRTEAISFLPLVDAKTFHRIAVRFCSAQIQVDVETTINLFPQTKRQLHLATVFLQVQRCGVSTTKRNSIGVIRHKMRLRSPHRGVVLRPNQFLKIGLKL